MSDETDARLLGALNDLLVEVMRLRADIAALRTGATTQPIDDGTAPAVAPQEAPGFADHYTDPLRRPEMYHPDLRGRSGTYVKTLQDPLARRVAGVPEALFLQWREPPGWYATDAQHAAWLKEHGGAAADTGGTTVGPA